MMDTTDSASTSGVPPVKDVLVFESEALPIEPTTEPNGDRYDLPLGDDIAKYLKGALEAAGTTWALEEPVREDFGAVLFLSRDKAIFTVTVSWQGGYMWALVFDRSRGCTAAGAAGAQYAWTRGLLFTTSHAAERKLAMS